MLRITLLILSLLFAAISVAEEDPPKLSTQWLSWPVTGYPFSAPDSGILIPGIQNRFEAHVRKDVIIGLRSDGVVVWKYIESPEEPSITQLFHLPKESEP